MPSTKTVKGNQSITACIIMTVRSFPRTRDAPQKRILLIPVVLIFGGLLMMQVTVLAFFGAIISLTGALSVFLVGMVYADLWASYRRTRSIIKAREERGMSDEEDLDDDYDPFVDETGVSND